MTKQLTLVVRSGPMIGLRQKIETDHAMVGGKGSAADIEISGLPYGVKYAEFRRDGPSRWRVEETTPGTLSINNRRLRRRTILANADQIAFPSLLEDEQIILEVLLEQTKSEVSAQPSLLKEHKEIFYYAAFPILLIILGVSMLLVGADDTEDERRPDIATLLEADLERSTPTFIESGLISASPSTYSELLVLLGSDIEAALKETYTQEFSFLVSQRFASARRLVDIGLHDEARIEYEDIIDLLGDAQLEATSQALEELDAIGNGGA